MSHNETLDIAGPAGRLEALLMFPESDARAAAVVCHAHPLHGGMMHFKVVFRAAKALQSQGLAVLRFNFRGVGRSEGIHDGGVGERDDARAAIDALEHRFPGLPLVLGGFSFGAAVALHLASEDQRVAAAFALGFPLRLESNPAYLSRREVPRLFAQGERDDFGDAASLARLVAGLTPPPALHILPSADHFFTGQLEGLFAIIAEWASSEPWMKPLSPLARQ